MGITDFFKSSKLKLTSNDIAEAGACPNCWGKQEWEGKFIAFERDRERDIINKDRQAQKAFVQQYIEERVTGIHLVAEGDLYVCPVCKKGHPAH